jgi:hypothetical protein
VSKFKSSEPQRNSGNNVASLDAARRARQQAAVQETQNAAERNMRKMLAEQVFMPYPEDSPLGRAIENASYSLLPPAPADVITPLNIDTKVKPQVPQGKADE